MKMKFKRIEVNGLCFYKGLLMSRVLIFALQMGVFHLESSVIGFIFKSPSLKLNLALQHL